MASSDNLSVNIEYSAPDPELMKRISDLQIRANQKYKELKIALDYGEISFVEESIAREELSNLQEQANRAIWDEDDSHVSS